MKKIISVILSLMLIASLSVTAFAAGETGSITINGVSTDTTYEIYKLLDLESYDAASGAYSYKANAAWAASTSSCLSAIKTLKAAICSLVKRI